MKTRIPYSVYRILQKCWNVFSGIQNTEYRIPAPRGFTLVEMIVSVALFAIVMLVCVGALLALVGANRKVHALQSVMNNLNITLDGMTRAIRMGSSFDGSAGCTGGLNGKDCTGGSTQFSFQPFGNPPGGQPWRYRVNNGRLERSIGGQAYAPITSPDVTIESLSFYVVGSARGCDVPSPCQPTQPKVVIVVKGTAPVNNSKAKTTFHIQVTAVQRLLDI
jgi:prepilin-type N-terminal cleavage/methylation domain-containing protein